MNKTLTTMFVLGTSAVLLVPTAGTAWAKGDDDPAGTTDDSGHGRGGDRVRTGTTPPPRAMITAPRTRGAAITGRTTPHAGDDDGTPDQGRGDNGSDDSTTPGDDTAPRIRGVATRLPPTTTPTAPADATATATVGPRRGPSNG